MSPIQGIVDQLLAGALGPAEATRQLAALVGGDGANEAERMLVARQYDSLAETLGSLVSAIDEFKGISGRSHTEVGRMLELARRRFAIQLSAALFDQPFPHDTEGGVSASSSIRRLKVCFSRLADSVADLVETAIRDSQLRKELEIAGTVQKMLVPASVVRVAGLIAHGWYRGAEQCSGDWWTLAPAGRDAMMVVGDVTGHGAPAAIIVGIVRGALDMARLGMGDELKPFMAMNMLNHILMDSVDGEYFMTAIIARYQPTTRSLLLANAGHRPPWILSGSGNRSVKGYRNAPLGTSRAERYQDEQVRLGSGELLVAFTDGLVGATSPDGREFGERALRAVCQQAYPLGPEALCAAVRHAVEAHVGALTLADDITFVVLGAPG